MIGRSSFDTDRVPTAFASAAKWGKPSFEVVRADTYGGRAGGDVALGCAAGLCSVAWPTTDLWRRPPCRYDDQRPHPPNVVIMDPERSWPRCGGVLRSRSTSHRARSGRSHQGSV